MFFRVPHLTKLKKNKEKADNFARMENEKHLKEIDKLKAAAGRAAGWADKNENTKIGFNPIKDLSNVDLPIPFAPTIAIRSPRSITMLIGFESGES